jgi:DNA-binding transcriptional regulator YdaS (Cro superfamily)
MSRQAQLTKTLRAGLDLAIEAVESQSELARRLGIRCQAISQWDRVPFGRILDIERVTGVPREQLRPDLYRETLR